VFDTINTDDHSQEESQMGYADDTSRLCHEIEMMRGARIDLKSRLARFAADLRRGMNEQRSAMRRRNAEDASRTKAELASFASNIRQMMRETLGGFERERHAAHAVWMRMPAPHRH
jgi:hypothetical protein